MSDAAQNIVVIDTGSWTTKAGFAGDNEPKEAIPTLVGRDAQTGTVKVGSAVRTDYDKLDVRCPLEDGYVSNWDDLEKLWSHVFADVLKVDSSTCNVLLTDSTTNSVSNREKMAQLMFEKFKVSKLYIAKQSVLGMYSTGRFSGLVVDSGHASTHVVPVYEGFCVSDGIERIPIGGNAISEYLAESLQGKGVKFSSKSFPVFEVANIKESMCKVAASFDDEVKATDKGYTLPDGTKVSVGKEAIQAAELLFRPQLADPASEIQPLPKVIQASIGKCEIDARAALTSAITLIGGTSMLSGYPERVSKEAVSLLGDRVKIISNSQRAQYSWIGGSVLASLPQTDWVTGQEYGEKGCGAVKKCP